jgi:hypothetical protein
MNHTLPKSEHDGKPSSMSLTQAILSTLACTGACVKFYRYQINFKLIGG